MATRMRRSELATPASNDWMFEKAANSGADMVFLDLEDAVAPKEKEKSRGLAVQALTSLDWGRMTRAVRINALDTQWAHGDIIEVVTGAQGALDMIVVPKVKTARDVWWVDVLLTQLETKLGMAKPIALEVLIEEVEALLHAGEIAQSSDRLEALIFGAGDFSASQGARVDMMLAPLCEYPGDMWHYARSKIIAAARAADLDAVDAPFPNFHDPHGYQRECGRASVLGFAGKWAIHPSQISIANEVFAPTSEEVSRARDMTEAYGKAEARGLGAVGADGVLVDAGSVRNARNILDKAELLGM